MNIEAKFKSDLNFKKEVIKTAAEKLGCSVEKIDLRSGFARLCINNRMVVVHFWRGINFENTVKQIGSAVRGA